MAEYILKDMAGDRYDASSAGLNAFVGDTMEPYAIRILDHRLAGNLHRLHRAISFRVISWRRRISSSPCARIMPA